MKGIAQIIYLNGPSSCGKTTLGKALQEAFEEPYLHIGIDTIIGWMPEKINDWTGGEAPLGFSWKKSYDQEGNLVQELQMGPYALQISQAFRDVVLALAKKGYHLIIDDVSFGKQQVEEWKELLKQFQVLWVGINAPLTVLEQREKERGNRIFGSARGQYHKVHQDASYDLEFDTYLTLLPDIVAKIVSAAESIEGNIPYQQISRTGVYGVARRDNAILLVIQKKGPYAGKFDLPGGGIEFGETIEQALHREFVEEVGMDFKAMQFLDNMTTCVEVHNSDQHYQFHQIGLIYAVQGLVEMSGMTPGLIYEWVDPQTLKQETVSPFVWNILRAASDKKTLSCDP